jgi:hypothetical protein
VIPWWKRLIYSLVSVMVGGGLTGAWIGAQQYIADSHGRISAVGLLIAIRMFDGWVVLLSLPGWFLACPIVLIVKNVRGWRFWMYLAIGVCFGPALILAVALYSALQAPSLAGFPGNSISVVYVAGAVSGLTTIIYLSLLRRAQTRSSLPAVVAAA